MDQTYPEFPALVLSKDGTMSVARTAAQLETCTRVALRNGYYRGLNIVDSAGREFTVGEARKVGTVGPFLGFNIFLNQRIRVHLEFLATVGPIDLEEAKARVLRYFKKWHGWQSRGDLHLLEARVQQAGSIPEVIACLSQDQTRK